MSDTPLIHWTPSLHPVNSALLDYIDAVIQQACNSDWPVCRADTAAQLRRELQERLNSL